MAISVILCISIIGTSVIGLCNDGSVVAKIVQGIIGDGARMYQFTSQSGERLPMLEYKDSIYVPVRSFCRYIGKEVDWSCGDVEIKPVPQNKYEGTVYGEEQTTYDYPIVSMIELIANPKKYDGKNVSVSGIINVGYESDLLYLTKDDYNYCITENSLRWNWYNFDFKFDAKDLTDFYEKMGDVSGVHVEMQGTFNEADISPNGFGSRGYLTNIKCIRCYEIIT